MVLGYLMVEAGSNQRHTRVVIPVYALQQPIRVIECWKIISVRDPGPPGHGSRRPTPSLQLPIPNSFHNVKGGGQSSLSRLEWMIINDHVLFSLREVVHGPKVLPEYSLSMQ